MWTLYRQCLHCSSSKSKSVISALFPLTAKVYLLTLGILTATSRMGCSNTEHLSLTSRLMNDSVLCRNRLEATRIPSVLEEKRKTSYFTDKYLIISQKILFIGIARITINTVIKILKIQSNIYSHTFCKTARDIYLNYKKKNFISLNYKIK